MPGWCGNVPTMFLKSIGVSLDRFGGNYWASLGGFWTFLALKPTAEAPKVGSPAGPGPTTRRQEGLLGRFHPKTVALTSGTNICYSANTRGFRVWSFDEDGTVPEGLGNSHFEIRPIKI